MTNMEVPNTSYRNLNGRNDKSSFANPSTLICFSHLRWDFVYQRPQHLLSRFASIYKVYFVEEPFFDAPNEPYLSFTAKDENLWVVTPHIAGGSTPEQTEQLLKKLLDKTLQSKNFDDLIFWYYTPMALAFSGHIKPALTIYDCMDELSNFKNAPRCLKDFEELLFSKADIVFTGGQSLYEAKKDKHHNIFAFPSSIDKKHFSQARTIATEPADQKKIKGPKLGFYGVIDERFDIDLLAKMAKLRPEWNFILLGPIVKINPDSLPQLSNVHLLGGKSYQELPAYVSGWDVALIPFAINKSTHFISPTKTPEYLSAGVPVVSTPIRDVVNPYGDKGIVKIASTAKEFVKAAEQYMKMEKSEWLPAADEFLADKSWSGTFTDMLKHINATLAGVNKNKHQQKTKYTYDLPDCRCGFCG